MITFIEVCECCNQIKIASPPNDFDWSSYVGSGNSSSCICKPKETFDERLERSLEENADIWAEMAMFERASDEDLFRFEEELKD